MVNTYAVQSGGCRFESLWGFGFCLKGAHYEVGYCGKKTYLAGLQCTLTSSCAKSGHYRVTDEKKLATVIKSLALSTSKKRRLKKRTKHRTKLKSPTHLCKSLEKILQTHKTFFSLLEH